MCNSILENITKFLYVFAIQYVDVIIVVLFDIYFSITGHVGLRVASLTHNLTNEIQFRSRQLQFVILLNNVE